MYYTNYLFFYTFPFHPLPPFILLPRLLKYWKFPLKSEHQCELYVDIFLDCTICTALIVIMLLLKESPTGFMDANSLTPVIVPSSPINELKDFLDAAVTFTVMVEGNEICSSNDFVFSFMVMFAAYYTFNLEYSPKAYGTLSFIQKYILKIGDQSKTKPKVLALMAKMTQS